MPTSSLKDSLATVADGMRLAALGAKGGNLYNCYHFLSQLAGLYSMAGGFDRHKPARATWDELSELVLADLGDLYALWDQVARLPASGPAPIDDPALGRIIARACQRAARLIELLTVWTPILKWADALQLSERRWQRVALQLGQSQPGLAPRLATLRTASLGRSARLGVLIETYRQEQRRLKTEPAATPPADEEGASWKI
jgi:hypothetical protein